MALALRSVCSSKRQGWSLMLLLLRGYEQHAHWRVDRHGPASGGEFACLHIDTKDHHVSGFLIRREQIVPGGIEREAAGNLALRRNMLDESQLAGPIYREHRDTVVATIRAV